MKGGGGGGRCWIGAEGGSVKLFLSHSTGWVGSYHFEPKAWGGDSYPLFIDTKVSKSSRCYE